MTTRKREAARALLDGVSPEQMAVELGLDELTYEACMTELFGRPPDKPRSESRGRPTVRVTQMGPGRRNAPTPTPKPKPEEK